MTTPQEKLAEFLTPEQASVPITIQYNRDIKKVSSNLRFNFIHRPLSDLFIVYNEQRAVSDQREMDPILSLKYANLLEF